MKKQEWNEGLNYIDPDLVEEYVEQKDKLLKKRLKNRYFVKWVSIAACLCLVVGIGFRIAIGFVPNQATDVFREGNLIEIANESELPAQYDGKLLAFNLDFENYEFYYKYDGMAENTNDWYSLLASKSSSDERIILHCMFGETTVEDWKVSRVFTKNATKEINVSGVNVQIARNEYSLQYEYWHYAIFEYDDVVYDIRVQSNDSQHIYDVLETLIKIV